jgi:hypothetical protein
MLLKIEKGVVLINIKNVLYHLHAYTVTVSYRSLYMNQVPEKLY